jgi:hypothetical protein
LPSAEATSAVEKAAYGNIGQLQKLSDDDFDALNSHVFIMDAAVTHTTGKLFNLDPAMYSMIDFDDKPICPGAFPVEDLPWKLDHTGCTEVIPNKGMVAEVCANEDQAFQGYKDWCAAKYCVVMEKKTTLQLVTGTLGMLGGLWSILGLVCFTILWSAINAAIQWHHRKTKAQQIADGVSLLQQPEAEMDAGSVYALHQRVYELQQQEQALSAVVAGK